MRGIVWGCNMNIAIEQLNKIAGKYEMCNYAKAIRKYYTKHRSWITFDNGDIWCAVSASERCRGLRGNIAYIDRNISEDIVN